MSESERNSDAGGLGRFGINLDGPNGYMIGYALGGVAIVAGLLIAARVIAKRCEDCNDDDTTAAADPLGRRSVPARPRPPLTTVEEVYATNEAGYRDALAHTIAQPPVTFEPGTDAVAVGASFADDGDAGGLPVDPQ